MKYCPNCGMQLPDDAKFCAKCGAPQPGAEGASPPAQSATPPSAPPQPPVPPQHQQPSPYQYPQQQYPPPPQAAWGNYYQAQEAIRVTKIITATIAVVMGLVALAMFASPLTAPIGMMGLLMAAATWVLPWMLMSKGKLAGAGVACFVLAGLYTLDGLAAIGRGFALGFLIDAAFAAGLVLSGIRLRRASGR